MLTFLEFILLVSVEKGDWLMMLKECPANECEGYHEGFCIMDELYKGFNPKDCNVKSNVDLMTEEEYDELEEIG